MIADFDDDDFDMDKFIAEEINVKEEKVIPKTTCLYRRQMEASELLLHSNQPILQEDGDHDEDDIMPSILSTQLTPILEKLGTNESSSLSDSDTESECSSLSSSISSRESFSTLDPYEDEDSNFLEGIRQELDIASLKEILVASADSKALLSSSRDVCGNTAVHLVCDGTRGSRQLIAEDPTALLCLLLEFGADVNAYNDQGHTPLMTCVTTSSSSAFSTKLASTLLLFGADPEAHAENAPSYHTPLYVAITYKMHDMAKTLVSKGASMNIKCEDGVMLYEKDRSMKHALFRSIKLPPTIVATRDTQPNECMACGTYYTKSKCAGNCVHCGRLCCANCLRKKIPKAILPPSFSVDSSSSVTFSSSSWMVTKVLSNVKTSSMMTTSPSVVKACTTCRDILLLRAKDETLSHSI